MPRSKVMTAEDRRRALRRHAATVASELSRKLQNGPTEIADFGPLVITVFQDSSSDVFWEIDNNQTRYEGRQENWFCLLRQVRNHSEWGPRLFESMQNNETFSTD